MGPNTLSESILFLYILFHVGQVIVGEIHNNMPFRLGPSADTLVSRMTGKFVILDILVLEKMLITTCDKMFNQLFCERGVAVLNLEFINTG